MGRFIFVVLALLAVVLDICLAGNISKKGKKRDRYMGTMLLLSGAIIVVYMVRAMVKEYFVTSLFSSFTSILIVFTLMFFWRYVIEYTRLPLFKPVRAFIGLIWTGTLLAAITQLVNPFYEIVAHYEYRAYSVNMWKTIPLLHYWIFVAWLGVIVTVILGTLTFRIFRTPAVYRMRYLTVVAAILALVAFNILFFMLSDDKYLNYAVLGYSYLGCFIYWNRFHYSTNGMLAGVRQMILDELDKPVFLFDRDDELVMCNALGSTFIDADRANMTYEEFVSMQGFSSDVLNIGSGMHFQWNRLHEGRRQIYRVDVKRLKDNKNHTIGKLMVLTDNSLELDILTGFHSKNSFEGTYRNSSKMLDYPVAVAVCDLNKLTDINRVMGNDMGDEAIKILANLMVKHCPKDTYFARLEDAHLLAVCEETSNTKMRNILTKIRAELEEVEGFSQKLRMQSAVSIATEEKPNIIDAVETSMFSVRSQKLMDGGSAHSSLLDSLAQTLLESDSTTQEHVRRTRNLGEMLGRRMGFTDVQLSNLALLCLLHDIGKLGIPMEILNKPGKLNSAEWDVMKSHVEKGYHIAKASKELEEIADLILHHHESWNGKGYPDGLKQEAIPLLSRVIAVVDTYDAMTNDRPYHKAVSEKAARDELKRCAGIQFDPNIVSEFIGLLEDLNPETDGEYVDGEVGKVDVYSNDTEERVITAPIGVKEIFERGGNNNQVFPIAYTKYILDENQLIVAVDENFEELTGYSMEDIKKFQLCQNDMIPADDRNFYASSVRKILAVNEEAFLEHRLLRKDGGVRNVVCFGKKFFDSVTRKPRFEIVTFDVSTSAAVIAAKKAEREIAQRTMERWESMTRRDSLTGLLNHESFINDVETELLKDDQVSVLMIIDVDYFKTYNDTYGHFQGDKLLTLVSAMLSKSVDKIGFAGRLGGDEFAAIINLPLGTDAQTIEEHVKKCYEMVATAIDALEKPSSISMGAAYLENMIGFNKLYQAADKALYRAKEKGKKCYSF